MISPTKPSFTRRAAFARGACIACASALSFGLPFFAPSVRAQAPAQTKIPQTKTPTPHLSVLVGLENNHLVLGQPIVLRYAIRSDNPYFSLPFEQPAPWMRVTLRDASGKTVATCGVESVRGAGSLRLIGWDKAGIANGPRVRFGFADGGAFVDRVFFGDQRLPVPSAGSYKLVVETTALWSDVPEAIVRDLRGERGSIRTDYRSAMGQTEQAKPDPDALPKWAERVSQPGQWDTSYPIAQRFVFPLKVERNPERLAQIAESWREKLKTQSEYEPYNDPLRGLLKPFGPYQIRPDPLLELFNLYGAPAEAVQNALADEYASHSVYERQNLRDLLNAVLRMGTPETIGWVFRYQELPQTHGQRGDFNLVYYQADRNVQKMLLKQLSRNGKHLSERLILDL